MSGEGNDIGKGIITDRRPWGNFKRYTYNQQCTVKIITVDPNQMVSKQAHSKRDELWVILDERLTVELDDKVIHPKAGDEIIIPRGAKHRLCAHGAKGRVLEISFGFFDEDDVERFDDLYGRQ